MQNPPLSKLIAAGSLAAGLSLGAAIIPATAAAEGQAAAEDAQVKVVYHINDAEKQALAALRNMRNHLDVAPDTAITVVAHSDGIEFLMSDYEDAETVASLVADLSARGVEFLVCEITLSRKDYDMDDFLLEADFTPSGVARLAELQHQEGYAYIKP